MRLILPNHVSGLAPAYHVGDEAAQICHDVLRKHDRVAVDIETEGLGAASFRVKAVIISTDNLAVVLDGRNERHKQAGREVLTTVKDLTFHNSTFDVPPLVAADWMNLGDVARVTDTVVWARMAYTDSLAGRGLEQLEPRLLSDQFVHSVKDRLSFAGKVAGWSKGQTFTELQYNDPVYTAYAAWDALVTHRIHDPLIAACKAQLTNHSFDAYGADNETAARLVAEAQKVNRINLWRSAKGLRIDSDLVNRQVEAIHGEQEAFAEVMASYGIEDFSNRNQLAKVLEDNNAFPDSHPQTATGKPSTAKAHLDSVDHPAARAFREYDQARRMVGYLQGALETAQVSDGRLHPGVNILGASTGRMSISNPPLQQYQGESRHAILPDDGEQVSSIDWSSIEPVMAASLADDRAVLDLYDAEEDLYEPAAKAAGIARKPAKIMSLADLYGQGIRLMSAQFNLETSEAMEIKAKLRSAMPKTAEFIENSRRWGEMTGKTWTVGGRIVDVPEHQAYKATNYTVQGSAYDQLSFSLAQAWDRGLADHFLIAMHDEIVCHETAAGEFQEIMETPLPRLVELTGRKNRLRTDRALLGERWSDEA